MAEQDGSYKIKKLQQRWISYQLLADFVLSAAIAFVLTSLLNNLLGWPVWLLIFIFAIVFGVFAVIRLPWQITLEAICSFLNIAYPELEESSGLAIKPA